MKLKHDNMDLSMSHYVYKNIEYSFRPMRALLMANVENTIASFLLWCPKDILNMYVVNRVRFGAIHMEVMIGATIIQAMNDKRK